MTYAWTMLVVAGILEAGWAIGLKYTDGFSRLAPSIFTIAAIAASLFLLAKAAQIIPIGTAYGVWVGIGTSDAVFLGHLLFKEPLPPARIFFLVLLLVSLVGLKLTTVTESEPGDNESSASTENEPR